MLDFSSKVLNYFVLCTARSCVCIIGTDSTFLYSACNVPTEAT